LLDFVLNPPVFVNQEDGDGDDDHEQGPSDPGCDAAPRPSVHGQTIESDGAEHERRQENSDSYFHGSLFARRQILQSGFIIEPNLSHDTHRHSYKSWQHNEYNKQDDK
jgi:hypothetical protein